MLGSFREVFKPTEEDIEKQTINYLRVIADLAEEKNCCTCKNSGRQWVNVIGGRAIDLYCKKGNSTLNHECKDYQIKSLEDLVK